MQDLLSFIQMHAKDKRENLACEVLAMLLREEPGQIVLQSLFKGYCMDDRPIDVTTQCLTEGCIPDILLRQDERPIGLLELKFWAPLTDHQLSGRYFKAAKKVVFVVPKERVSHVDTQLASLRAGIERSTLAFKNELLILPWEKLLCDIADQLPGSDGREERLFVGALEHLKEFCGVIEQEGFTPFTQEELHNSIRDESTRHLVWLTRRAIELAIERQVIGAAGKLGPGYDTSFFYGQKVSVGGLSAWIGYWPKAWKKSEESGPLWAQFFGSDAAKFPRSDEYKNGIPVEGKDLAFPLYASPIVSTKTHEDEAEAIFESIARLADHIRSHTSASCSNSAL